MIEYYIQLNDVEIDKVNDKEIILKYLRSLQNSIDKDQTKVRLDHQLAKQRLVLLM